MTRTQRQRANGSYTILKVNSASHGRIQGTRTEFIRCQPHNAAYNHKIRTKFYDGQLLKQMNKVRKILKGFSDIISLKVYYDYCSSIEID